MKTPGLRLKRARAHSGFKSARAAALHFGWPPSTYTAHESGLRNYDLKFATKYANCFEVSTAWLMTGENAPNWVQKSKKIKDIPHILEVSQIETIKLPILQYNHLIDLALKKASLKDKMLQKDFMDMVLKDGYSDSVIVLRVEDNLNLPNLKPMDLVLVDLEQKPDYGKRVAAVLEGYNTPVIARLQQDLQDGKTVDVLRFDNEGVNDIKLNKVQCIALYKIIGITVFE